MADPGLPQTLPDEAFLIQRMGMSDNVAASARNFLATISATVLGLISKTCSIPMPSKTIMTEAVYYRGNVPYLLTNFWPVTSLLTVFPGSSQTPLRIGSELSVARGLADIAITGPGGETLTVPQNWWYPGTTFFVSYVAGMDALPADLLEVYVELSFLLWKEKDRVGLKKNKDDVGEIEFTRDLPPWALRAMRSYKRIYSFV
jgi:hypothetical protein